MIYSQAIGQLATPGANLNMFKITSKHFFRLIIDIYDQLVSEVLAVIATMDYIMKGRARTQRSWWSTGPVW